MSIDSVNPCAGVSVARSIRQQFPFATLVAVDDGGGPAVGGMSDPIFDRVISTAIMGGSSILPHGSKKEKFEAIMSILSSEKCAYFLPVSKA